MNPHYINHLRHHSPAQRLVAEGLGNDLNPCVGRGLAGPDDDALTPASIWCLALYAGEVFCGRGSGD